MSLSHRYPTAVFTPRLTGADVRAFRGRFGLSQTQLAVLLEITQTTVSCWETGHRQPQPNTWRLLRDLEEHDLRTMADERVGGTKEPTATYDIDSGCSYCGGGILMDDRCFYCTLRIVEPAHDGRAGSED